MKMDTDFWRHRSRYSRTQVISVNQFEQININNHMQSIGATVLLYPNIRGNPKLIKINLA